MCIGIPVRVVESYGFSALCEGRNGVETINLMLVGDQPAGTWLLSFLGSAREVLGETEAAQINAALDGLEAVNRGEFDFDRAFPDLAAGVGLPSTGESS